LTGDIKKELDANEFSFGHLTLILSLHYLAKCISRSVATYNIHTGQHTRRLRNDYPKSDSYCT